MAARHFEDPAAPPPPPLPLSSAGTLGGFSSPSPSPSTVPVAGVVSRRRCQWCVRGLGLKVCGGCRAAWYCSAGCQRAAWTAPATDDGHHRSVCARDNWVSAALRLALIASATGTPSSSSPSSSSASALPSSSSRSSLTGSAGSGAKLSQVQGRGWVATRAIAAGEPLLRAHAFVIGFREPARDGTAVHAAATHDGDELAAEDVCAAMLAKCARARARACVDDLSPSEDEVAALPADSLQWRAYDEEVSARMRKRQLLEQEVEDEERADAEATGGPAAVAALPPALGRAWPAVTAADVRRLRLILTNNQFSTVTVAASSSSRAGTALFPLASYFNHSCWPNAGHHLDYRRGTLHVRALRAIAAGEQVCVQYTGLYPESRAHTRAKLRAWGFDCACDMCRGATSQLRAIAASFDALLCPRCNDAAATMQPPDDADTKAATWTCSVASCGGSRTTDDVTVALDAIRAQYENARDAHGRGEWAAARATIDRALALAAPLLGPHHHLLFRLLLCQAAVAQAAAFALLPAPADVSESKSSSSGDAMALSAAEWAAVPTAVREAFRVQLAVACDLRKRVFAIAVATHPPNHAILVSMCLQILMTLPPAALLSLPAASDTTTTAPAPAAIGTEASDPDEARYEWAERALVLHEISIGGGHAEFARIHGAPLPLRPSSSSAASSSFLSNPSASSSTSSSTSSSSSSASS